MAVNWFVYIVRCRDKTLYTGISTDPQRRLEDHNHGPRGAKYTRARRPVQLVYVEEAGSRAEACRREYAIKQMTLSQKRQLIGGVEHGV